MKTETVINKVVITAEAEFDYESEFKRPLPKKELKRETEEYIGGRLSRFNGYYFRAKYFDEMTDRMLMLFVYRGEVFGSMQIWEIRGICPAEDWTSELEEDGQVRVWLKSKLDTAEETDWVWDLRVREEIRRKELAEEFGEAVESSMPEIKNLLENYKINKARIAVGSGKEIDCLKTTVEFLEKCIDQLDDEAKAIITLLYVQGQSMSKVGRKFGYCKSAVHKKRNRALQILEILFESRKQQKS